MEHIRKAFDEVATEYDAQREYIIPDMRNYYGAAIWAAETPTATPAILDIGAGTGLLSALLLEKYPSATLTLLDISEKMLAVAQERFRNRENVRSGLGIIHGWILAVLTILSAPPSQFITSFRNTSTGFSNGCARLFLRAGCLSTPTRPKGRRRILPNGTGNTGTNS